MLLTELNRMASHLLFLATNGMDLGAVSMMLYGWREREEVLRFFQKVTGLRMNHNFIRPGGVAADLPDGWEDDVAAAPRADPAPPRRVRRPDDQPADLARAAAGRRRDHRRRRRWRCRPPARSCARPACRGTCARRCRTSPTTRSSSTSSSARTVTASTGTPSGSTRCGSRSGSCGRSSTRCLTGDYRVQDKKVTPPPRARIDESMEALIHHFKIFTEGFRVPEGEVYVAIESPRGSSAATSCRDGGPKPYRMHIRGRASSTCRRCRT